MNIPKHGALSISLRTATVLLLFSLAFTTLMAVVYNSTQAPIAASRQAEKLRLINELLPPGEYDNDLMKDVIDLPATPAIGLEQTTRLYRARKEGQPAALIFEAAAADGYSGHIGLLLAMRANGELIAVRVTDHKETPGLGDYIDPRKDKNKEHPWIQQFAGKNMDKLPTEKWRVKKDGGHFEQRSGATISARAVTQAVARAVKWATPQRHHLFDAASTSTP